MITIYHNGECSKSRGALEIMQDLGTPHNVRWYLVDPLSKDELKALLGKLSMAPSQLVRKSEPLYKELYEGREITEEQWLDILVENPLLIERPIVEKGDMAIVARPPECIYEVLNSGK
jgi:arsenate reductase